MQNSPVRPDNLANFTNPPLNEVYMGVQFSRPKGYQQIHAGDVWKLFRDKYPIVEEYPAIPPNFETFGLHSPNSLAGEMNFVTTPFHNRYWFISSKKEQLIQFQQDRLLHNWRKVDAASNYLRFENLISPFKNELDQFQQFITTLEPQSQSLVVNQCEISYINHIQINASEKISDWLSFFIFNNEEPEFFGLNFNNVIRAEEGEPLGRLICEVVEATNAEKQKIIVLTLTFRGAPINQTIESAIDFISMGRELIIKKFVELTSETAHKIWGRIK